MVVGEGEPGSRLEEGRVLEILSGMPQELCSRKKVLILTPDATRTCPLPMMVKVLKEVMGGRCSRLDFMVALGTHPPLGRSQILELYGIHGESPQWANTRFMSHRWDLPETFVRIGSMAKEEVEELSGGILREEVPIEINRHVLDYDLILILGPVFPHEVVGFSGGAKYLFPGISGGEFLHFFHWLGALITCKKIIGIKDTPVRKLIHRAARMLPVQVQCVAMVVEKDSGVCGLFVGDLEDAWSTASELSGCVHVIRKPKPYHTVLGRAPKMYDELWTAGKVMYKLEQVVAPGGTLIIYAPHVKKVSRTWGLYIERVGYHTRDYILAHMDLFRDVPKGVLAHLTHVKGTGTFTDGLETPDVNVVLATGIPAEVCRKINLGHMDPESLWLQDYMGREEEGILFVDKAGEILYKLEERAAKEKEP